MWRKFDKFPSLLVGILAISILVGTTNGQKFSLGSCPTLTGATVTTAGLTGTWYEYERTTSFQEHSIRCPVYTWTFDAVNTRFLITVTGRTKITGNVVSTNGYATLPNGVTVGTLFVRFPSLLFSKFPLTYYIIATDATGAAQGTYMVLYSCQNIGIGKLENVIILTSLKFPLQTTIDTAEAAAGARISTNLLKKTDQTNC